MFHRFHRRGRMSSLISSSLGSIASKILESVSDSTPQKCEKSSFLDSKGSIPWNWNSKVLLLHLSSSYHLPNRNFGGHSFQFLRFNRRSSPYFSIKTVVRPLSVSANHCTRESMTHDFHNLKLVSEPRHHVVCFFACKISGKHCHWLNKEGFWWPMRHSRSPSGLRIHTWHK